MGGASSIRPITVLALALACTTTGRADSDQSSPRAEAESFDAAAYERTLEAIEAERKALGRRFDQAATKAARAAIRDQARRYVVATIIDEIFPAWMGTPWGLGKTSTSLRPHQAGMTVGCSYFVTSVLLNAGLRLANRYRFAQAPALHIQRSLAPARSSLLRYLSIPAKRLRDRVAELGDGLYLAGLNNHVGFIVVAEGEVRFVHSSYTTPGTVQDEPLVTSAAIAASQRAGYFVTPLFQDDRLIDMWLRGEEVPFQKLGYP